MLADIETVASLDVESVSVEPFGYLACLGCGRRVGITSTDIKLRIGANGSRRCHYNGKKQFFHNISV